MKITAVIAEYNLLHCGHLRQINLIREHSGEDTVIVALMSGNYVQRGEMAITDKFTRAAAAVDSGVDIVLELPYPWSCGSAEYFATAAISLLSSFKGKLGKDDIDFSLCFGSECGDIEKLLKISERFDASEYKEELEKIRSKPESKEISDILIREQAYREVFGDVLPKRPNDILGIEYLNSIRRLDADIIPYTVKREGNESATLSRKYYINGDFDSLFAICPGSILSRINGRVPMTLDRAQQAILAYLRLSDRNNPPESDGMTFGLWNRFCRMSTESSSLSQFFSLCNTKKYTDARLRRTLIHAFFSTSRSDLCERPMYTTVLAMSEKGREILALIRKDNSPFSVFTKQAHAFDNNESILKQFMRNLRADSFYSLIEGKDSNCYLKVRPYIKDKK